MELTFLSTLLTFISCPPPSFPLSFPPASPLFPPDVEGLRCLHYIQSLRREAHQALNEHVRLIHREDTTRFAKLLIALSMLRAISPPVVAQLFFRPVIGTVSIEEVLMEMFYGK